MEKITRNETPDFLKEKAEEWGKEWSAKQVTAKKMGKTATFSWRQYKKQEYKEILAQLQLMTDNCAYCNIRLLHIEVAPKPSIDHFRPKTTFPLLAYEYGNLFPCCEVCQERGNRFDELLLKPDEQNYDFDAYFIIDFPTGELRANPQGNGKQKSRADKTIELFKLNSAGKSQARLKELRCYEDNQMELSDLSYHFFLTRS
jgi:uncharacterized protein (TIGR02646 family)